MEYVFDSIDELECLLEKEWFNIRNMHGIEDYIIKSFEL